MNRPLVLSLAGVSYPMRGGIAQYTAILAQELARKHDVELVSFTRQYPSFLFPGKTQLESSESVPRFPATPMIDSIAPWSWLRAGEHIARRRPDGLLYKYWMPFFAPALGTIARRAKAKTGSGRPRTIMIVDNLIPHEPRPLDLSLTRWLMRVTDAYIVQSGSVRDDLLRLDPQARFLEVPHPVYHLFGERIDKKQAREKLGLDSDRPCLLFFGFVRAYKGLDTLIRALSLVRSRWQNRPSPAAGSGLPPLLLVLGEFYGGREETERLIEGLGLGSEILLRDEYVPNERVGLFFSAADVVVLPYRSATQSGIVQIAYQLDRPVICTDVGGLAEVVLHERTGFVVPPENEEALARAILQYYAGACEEPFVEAIRVEKRKYSWDRMVEAVEALVQEE